MALFKMDYTSFYRIFCRWRGSGITAGGAGIRNGRHSKVGAGYYSNAGVDDKA